MLSPLRAGTVSFQQDQHQGYFERNLGVLDTLLNQVVHTVCMGIPHLKLLKYDNCRFILTLLQHKQENGEFFHILKL